MRKQISMYQKDPAEYSAGFSYGNYSVVANMESICAA